MLAIFCLKAKAQIIYEAVPTGGAVPTTLPTPTPMQYPTYNPMQYQPPKQRVNIQYTVGYYFTENGHKAVNLRIVIGENDTRFIVAVKPMGQDYWTTFNETRISLSLLRYQEPHSDIFQYKAYIPVLGEEVYLQ